MTSDRASKPQERVTVELPSTANAAEVYAYLEQVLDAVEDLQRSGLDFTPPARLREIVVRLHNAFNSNLRSGVSVRSVPIAQAIRMLIRPGGTVTTRTLRARLLDAGVEASSGAVSMALSRAVHAGELERVGPGRYHRPETTQVDAAPRDEENLESLLGEKPTPEQSTAPPSASPNDTEVLEEDLLRKFIDEYGGIIRPKEAGHDGQAPSEAVVGT